MHEFIEAHTGNEIGFAECSSYQAAVIDHILCGRSKDKDTAMQNA